MKLSAKVAIGCASITTFVIVVGIVEIWHPTRPSPADDELPQLVRGLPKGLLTGKTAFDARVKARIPDGTDSHKLLSLLEREGFHARNIGNESLLATFEQKSSPCAYDWGVSWQVDSHDLARHISGHFTQGCP